MALAAPAAILVACEGSPGEPRSGAVVTLTTDPDGNQTAHVTISMKDDFFEPAEFVVPVGLPLRVEAVNDGVVVHNLLVEGPGGGTAFRSDIRVSPGESSVFEAVFNEPGSYRFTCGFHLPDMAGAIVAE